MKEQFKIIYDRWYESLFSYVYKKTYDMDVAQEIVQIVFIKLWTKGGEKIINDLYPQKWLFRVARNLIIDRYRLTVQKREMEEDLIYITDEFDIENKNFIDIIYENLKMLPKKCRLVIEMCLNGKKTSEIMCDLRISQQNVLNQKTIGIKILRKKLKSCI